MVTLHAALAALVLTGAAQTQTVLLDFYADWCGPCRQMNPVIERLAADGYAVQRVNVDQNRALAIQYGVRTIPCFVMLVNGREVDRVNEPTTYSRLERMCKLAAPPAVAQPSPLMRAQDGASAATPPAAEQPGANVVPAGFTGPPNVSLPSGAGIPPAGAGADRQPGAGQLYSPLHVEAGRSPDGPPAKAAPVPDSALIAASVRLRVQDPNGRSCGSGTIIDSRKGEAMVLTCGHIFRDSQGKGKIEVDLFTAGPSAPQVVTGELHSYDLKRDVGLVTIRVSSPVMVARLAPAGYRVAEGQPVVTVGCNNGGDPTAQHSQVTRLNRFQGPQNIEVAGQPVEGRSGGGLFTTEGYVIGVCNAADPSDREGLFVSADEIRAQLDEQQLATVYQAPSGNLVSASSAAGPMAPTAAATAANPATGPSDFSAGVNATPPSTGPSGLAAHEQAAMEEIRHSLREGAEVVVVVRPRGKPDAQSQVIMLDHVSPEFLKQLADEQKPHGPPYATASKPRKTLLEWPAPQTVPATSDRRP
ncbi:MAG: thioredoxin domain-containing protein [Thermoguttaceae bacterium]